MSDHPILMKSIVDDISCDTSRRKHTSWANPAQALWFLVSPMQFVLVPKHLGQAILSSQPLFQKPTHHVQECLATKLHDYHSSQIPESCMRLLASRCISLMHKY